MKSALTSFVMAVAATALAAALSNFSCPNGTSRLDRYPFSCMPGPHGCPPGTVQNTLFPLGSSFGSVIECRLCPPGFTTFRNGSRTCRRIGFPCPLGHFETNSGDCVRCRADEFFDLEYQICLSCPVGSGCVSGHSLWCAPCSSFIKLGLSSPRCSLDGNEFVLVGEKCPAGSTLSYRDSGGSPICRKCEKGTFTTEQDSDECTSCPENWVSDEGASSCTSCEGDMIPSDDRSECVHRESGCRLGEQLAQVQGQAFCRSPSCLTGNDSYPEALGRRCGPCHMAHYTNRFMRDDGSCWSCPGNSFSDGLSCIRCPRGQVRVAEGGCACHGALALNRGVDENGNCVRCARGSRGVPGPDGEHVCTMCPAGTWFIEQSDEELLGGVLGGRPFSSLCALCEENMVTTESGSVRCQPCAEDTFKYRDGSARCYREGERSAPVAFTDAFGNAVEV